MLSAERQRRGRAGRSARIRRSVPGLTDFPGLSASGARCPCCFARCARFAQRQRVSCRSSLRSPPPNPSSPAPTTRAAACPPAPLRVTEDFEGTHATAVAEGRPPPHVPRAVRGDADRERPHATTVAGERLGVRTRRAVGGGEDRKPGGGERSELRKLTRRRCAKRAQRAKQHGRRAPGLRTGKKSAPPGPTAGVGPPCPHPEPLGRSTRRTSAIPSEFFKTHQVSVPSKWN
jgi:hypothetical protein